MATDRLLGIACLALSICCVILHFLSVAADRYQSELAALRAAPDEKGLRKALEDALRVRRDEFFHDGLSADLSEGEITTVEDAYVEGYRDAEDEVVLRLREVLDSAALRPAAPSKEAKPCQVDNDGTCWTHGDNFTNPDRRLCPAPSKERTE